MDTFYHGRIGIALYFPIHSTYIHVALPHHNYFIIPKSKGYNYNLSDTYKPQTSKNYCFEFDVNDFEMPIGDHNFI